MVIERFMSVPMNFNDEEMQIFSSMGIREKLMLCQYLQEQRKETSYSQMNTGYDQRKQSDHVYLDDMKADKRSKRQQGMNWKKRLVEQDENYTSSEKLYSHLICSVILICFLQIMLFTLSAKNSSCERRSLQQCFLKMNWNYKYSHEELSVVQL